MEPLRNVDQYLAESWEKTLLADLLWRVEDALPGTCKSLDFPSWSWAPTHLRIEYPSFLQSRISAPLAWVRDIPYVPVGPSHLGPSSVGPSSEAAIVLKAPLMELGSFWRFPRNTAGFTARFSIEGQHESSPAGKLLLPTGIPTAIPPVQPTRSSWLALQLVSSHF
jgi:hypothetical protein